MKQESLKLKRFFASQISWTLLYLTIRETSDKDPPVALIPSQPDEPNSLHSILLIEDPFFLRGAADK